MAKINPYCAGSGRRPRILAGRSRQLAIIENLANQFEGRRPAENVVWTGLRGMGKTVLLREALDLFHDRGWLAGYHEVRRSPGIGASVASIVIQGNSVLGRGKLAKSLSWLRELVASASISATAGDITFKLGLAPSEGGGGRLPEDALDVLFVRLGEAAADAGVGAVLLFDELQLIARDDLSALLHAAQAAESLPIAFVAAGLPDLPGAMASAGSYAERLYHDRVDWLNDDDVRQAIVLPAEEFEVSYEPEALQLLVNSVSSYPHFAQLYPEEAWKVAGTPSDQPGRVITCDEVQGALEPAQFRLDDGLYKIRFEKASDAERSYLVAMAGIADTRIASGDVARRIGRTAQQCSPLRDRLIQKGIVYSPAHNVIEFAIPGFAGYLRRAQGADVPPIITA